MPPTVAVIVPTRSRPHHLPELLDAWDATAEGGWCRLVVAVDGCDHVDRYLAVDLPDWAEIRVEPWRRLAGTLNAVSATLDDPAVGFMGDDHRPRSAGWDRRVAETLAETPMGVVWGDDLIQGADLCTHVFMDNAIIGGLGFMVPRNIQHMYVDNFWMLLGRNLGTLRYLPDVVIEHSHPVANRRGWDDQYKTVNHPDQYARDHAAFAAYLASDFADDLAKLCNGGAA